MFELPASARSNGLSLLRRLRPGAVLLGRFAVERVVPTLSRPGEAHPDPVLRAWDAARGGEPVCVKVDLVPEGAAGDPLARPAGASPMRVAAALMARWDCPSLPGLVALGAEDGHQVLVSSWLPGAPLPERVGQLSAGERRQLCTQLVDAVAHLHARGVVHRDIKPGNLLVAGEGAEMRLGLVDFGLAVDAAGPAPAPGGTIGWTAPEQLTPGLGVDPRWDLYAVGTTLALILTGRPLFPTGAGALAAQQRGAFDPDVVAALPDALRALVLGLIARDPAARYPSAAAAASELAIAASTGGFFVAEGPGRVAPPAAPVVAQLPVLLAQGRPDLVLAHDTGAGEPPAVLEVRARALLACREWRQAAAVADLALALDPESGGALLVRARAAFGEGQADAAGACLDRFAGVWLGRAARGAADPRWQDWAAEAVDLEVRAGRLAHALDLASGPGDARLLAGLARVLARRLRSDHHRREPIEGGLDRAPAAWGALAAASFAARAELPPGVAAAWLGCAGANLLPLDRGGGLAAAVLAAALTEGGAAGCLADLLQRPDAASELLDGAADWPVEALVAPTAGAGAERFASALALHRLGATQLGAAAAADLAATPLAAALLLACLGQTAAAAALLAQHPVDPDSALDGVLRARLQCREGAPGAALHWLEAQLGDPAPAFDVVLQYGRGLLECGRAPAALVLVERAWAAHGPRGAWVGLRVDALVAVGRVKAAVDLAAASVRAGGPASIERTLRAHLATLAGAAGAPAAVRDAASMALEQPLRPPPPLADAVAAVEQALQQGAAPAAVGLAWDELAGDPLDPDRWDLLVAVLAEAGLPSDWWALRRGLGIGIVPAGLLPCVDAWLMASAGQPAAEEALLAACVSELGAAAAWVARAQQAAAAGQVAALQDAVARLQATPWQPPGQALRWRIVADVLDGRLSAALSACALATPPQPALLRAALALALGEPQPEDAAPALAQADEASIAAVALLAPRLGPALAFAHSGLGAHDPPDVWALHGLLACVHDPARAAARGAVACALWPADARLRSLHRAATALAGPGGGGPGAAGRVCAALALVSLPPNPAAP